MTSAATAGQVPDVYGQVHPVETSELIGRKMADFDQSVKDFTMEASDANKDLIEAMTKCPELLTKAFKLMFLRSEVFNVNLAIRRYANYWKNRVKVFGPNKAFEPLTLEKALSDDTVALELGLMRLVAGVTDPAGRAIIYLDPSVQDRTKYTCSSMCRAVWYTVHAALESETAQKHGVLIIGNPSKARFRQFDRELSKSMLPSIQGAIPLRLSGLHVCHPPAFTSIILPIVKLFMSERTKKRLLIHNGSSEKVIEKLGAYGLERSMLPEDLGGNVKLDHVSWLTERRSRGL